MKQIALFISAFFLFSCNNAEKKEEKSEVGKYLYVDRDSTLHIKQRCTKFILKDEQDYGVKRISSENIPPEYLEKCCSYCVDDAAYEILESRRGKIKIEGFGEN